VGSKIQNDWMISTYRPKDCDFSATDICMPEAQLWAKVNSTLPEKDKKVVSFKSYLGSALHNAIESIDEDGVVKEFSWVRDTDNGYRVGGTADELRFRTAVGKWRLGDIKLKTDYPAKKFLGIGTKTNPNPKPEQEKEQLQMSVYRWLFTGLYDIEDKGVIYLFVPGHNKWAQYDEYQEVWLDLLPVNIVNTYVNNKINVAHQKEQPKKDCEDWLCDYCDYRDACTYVQEKEPGFGDES
jgi:hypothetical protein